MCIVPFPLEDHPATPKEVRAGPERRRLRKAAHRRREVDGLMASALGCAEALVHPRRF